VTTDWESILRLWAKPPSENEDEKRKKTESQIRDALKASPSLSGMGYKVYAKGSYANNTNVRLDYDVDIAVECTDFYYHDKVGAAADVKKAAVERLFVSWSGRYSREDFKTAVAKALNNYFGATAITEGNIAFRVREKKTTLPADVVPCYEYHYIYDANAIGAPIYYKGTRIFPNKGSHIHNWSDQQLSCGNLKNDATGRRYKRMVRIIKRLENELVDAKVMDDLPSFFMECLVYNVPNEYFKNRNYKDDLRAVLASIFNASKQSEKCKDWLEASERKYLFHPSQPWTMQQAHDLASNAWNLIGYS
jgi:predicted nucleotidyltransferase